MNMNGCSGGMADSSAEKGPPFSKPSKFKQALIRESALQASDAVIPPSECPATATEFKSKTLKKGLFTSELIWTSCCNRNNTSHVLTLILSAEYVSCAPKL